MLCLMYSCLITHNAFQQTNNSKEKSCTEEIDASFLWPWKNSGNFSLWRSHRAKVSPITIKISLVSYSVLLWFLLLWNFPGILLLMRRANRNSEIFFFFFFFSFLLPNHPPAPNCPTCVSGFCWVLRFCLLFCLVVFFLNKEICLLINRVFPTLGKLAADINL